ncbi:hypothetical protein CANARDRAFT_10237 [[Candida] arabinofermentans NRRL YB-2248]|uniref:Phosphatidic acid phosphatase type 2/haloperoxidase domain-containing protein n=1 Tax=[Candida] arabinofermentans NRRL YB-2248 TaxID=983967 RepID=A0A1E4STF5_9ASCO|nr:hypothetical protein CANARDRAFT_10237 [[Candida] arabinofermentans NRRL YB-2248]
MATTSNSNYSKVSLNPVVLITRLYYEFLSAKKQNNKLIELNLEFKPTFKHFKHLPRSTIVNLSFLTSVFLFVLYVLPISFIMKFLLASGLIFLVTCPILSQFFLFGLPVLAWVFLFFSAPKIPVSWRPPISVKVLPSMETILYGDDLSVILATRTNMLLDFLAWFPYGIIHFVGPFVVAALVWLFGPPTALRSFGWSIGYMNLIGVIIQTLFAAAPPWYKNLYGLLPANYSMKGSPGGLGRMDDYFGFDMYTTTFSTAPVIFGAFPSLHSGISTMNALWLSYLFPKYSLAFFFYVCWLWWATMYLTHHYFFDLTAGTALAITFYYFARIHWLPIKKAGLFCRFNYTVLEYEDLNAVDPLNPINFNSTGGIVVGSAGEYIELDEELSVDDSSSGQSTPVDDDDGSTVSSSVFTA